MATEKDSEGPGGGSALRSEQFAEYARRTADPVRRAELYLQAAQLAEDIEQDAEHASALYRSALESDSHQSTALVALERIYLRTSNWPGLYRVYGLHADALDAEGRHSARAEICAKMAHLAAERLEEEELAATCYENLLEASPGAPEAIRYLLNRSEQAGDWGAIELLLREQTPKVDDAKERAELLRILGDALQFHLDKAPEAVKAYKEAYTADALNRKAFRGLLASLEAAGQTGELLQVFEERERALRKRGANGTGEQELFEVRLQLFDLLAGGDGPQRKKAADMLAAAATLRPDEPQVLRREAEFAIASGDFARGARAYETLLEAMPRGTPARLETLLTVVELYRTHLGRKDEARKVLQEIMDALLEDPTAGDLATAQRVMAELAWERGDFDEAQVCYEAVLDKTPEQEKAARCEYLLRLAQIAEGMGKPDEALRRYGGVLEFFPRFRRALRGKAALLIETAQWQEALGAQLAYVEAIPKSEIQSDESKEAQVRLGRIYENLGDTKRAEALYVGLLRRGWDVPGVREGLARVFEASGNLAEAAEQWNALRAEAKERRNTSRWAEATERLAYILERRGQREDARELFEEVAKKRPGRILTHERLAAMAEADGRWAEAQKHYHIVVENLPKHASEEARRHAVQLLEKAERNAFFEGDS